MWCRKNSEHLVIQRLYNPFHCVAYDYSRADWDGLRDYLRDVP